MSIPSSCARRSNTASNSSPGPLARDDDRQHREAAGDHVAAAQHDRVAPAAMRDSAQRERRQRAPACWRPAARPRRRAPRTSRAETPDRRRRGRAPRISGIVRRRQHAGDRQAVVAAAGVHDQDLVRPAQADQVRRHVADQVADRVFLVADGDDDRKLRLAMNALRQGGGLAVDNYVSRRRAGEVGQ